MGYKSYRPQFEAQLNGELRNALENTGIEVAGDIKRIMGKERAAEGFEELAPAYTRKVRRRATGRLAKVTIRPPSKPGEPPRP